MIYCTSDLHGAPLSELESLLDKAGFSENDFLFILGDVIDRGKNSTELLKWLLFQPNAQLILGNHEAMLLSCSFIFEELTEDSLAALDAQKMELLSNWMSNGGEETIKELKELNSQDRETLLYILEYLREAPLYDTVSVGGNDFLLCHSGLGGFSKDKKLREYSEEEWLWTRPELTDEYFSDIITVFGHTPTAYFGGQYSGHIIKKNSWICIDTSPKLSLLRLDDLKEFYL